ncbi:hypothetical protein [Hymenobacter sp. BT770]|uniref:hypothetical protein n=1 Tax=Hymenobacter sp. BT770 TaxID=2886942 RepID=UPI001D0F5890|nr:hypothetical protein [Hymenobacter sp. BT770]MCC3152998.1 hypothetical protein [Hymenobacter sp. BT770]
MNQDAFDKPSGTLGGMLSSLFRGGSRSGQYNTGRPSGGGFSRKLLSGALLAAGAAYLYNRSNRSKSGNVMQTPK